MPGSDRQQGKRDPGPRTSISKFLALSDYSQLASPISGKSCRALGTPVLGPNTAALASPSLSWLRRILTVSYQCVRYLPSRETRGFLR